MTLSDLSYYVRKFGPFAVILFVLFIIFYVLITSILSSISNRPEPVVYEPRFGKLEPINFTHDVGYPPSFTLAIDNIEGRPLTATSSAGVYYIPSSRTRFGYQQTIAFMAKAVGINPEKQAYTVTDTRAEYDDGNRKLDVDITTFNYAFEMNYGAYPEIFENTIIPNENKVKEDAKVFLRQMNKFSPDLAQGAQHVIYLKYDTEEDDFIVVDNVNLANVVEVDFYPPDIGPFPAVPPTYFNSQNYVTLIYKPSGHVIIKSQVRFFEKDMLTTGPYPIKTGDQAWGELNNRKGIIASPTTGSTDIIIREMFLGYYEPEEYQNFLMPVYVFLGDNGFAGYVSAVEDGYVETVVGEE